MSSLGEWRNISLHLSRMPKWLLLSPVAVPSLSSPSRLSGTPSPSSSGDALPHPRLRLHLGLWCPPPLLPPTAPPLPPLAPPVPPTPDSDGALHLWLWRCPPSPPLATAAPSTPPALVAPSSSTVFPQAPAPLLAPSSSTSASTSTIRWRSVWDLSMGYHR